MFLTQRELRFLVSVHKSGEKKQPVKPSTAQPLTLLKRSCYTTLLEDRSSNSCLEVEQIWNGYGTDTNLQKHSIIQHCHRWNGWNGYFLVCEGCLLFYLVCARSLKRVKVFQDLGAVPSGPSVPVMSGSLLRKDMNRSATGSISVPVITFQGKP